MDILCAVGWGLAAFLCGFLAGRVRDAPTAKRQKRERQEPLRDNDQEAAEKARREWRNFLEYDGTAQVDLE